MCVYSCVVVVSKRSSASSFITSPLVGLLISLTRTTDLVLPKLFPTKRYVICPMIDMTNHQSATPPNAKVAYEFFGNAYSLALTQPVNDANAEICISYGERSNDQLLQYYGFVEPNNPHDVYVLPPMGEWDLQVLLEGLVSSNIPPGRLAALDKVGLLSTEGVVVTRRDGLDPSALRALRVLLASPSEWEAAGEAVTAMTDAATSAETEACVRKAARALLEAELAAKPTTLAQDRLLLGRSNDVEERLAIAFRIEKKMVLTEAIQRLS